MLSVYIKCTDHGFWYQQERQGRIDHLPASALCHEMKGREATMHKKKKTLDKL